MRLHQRLVHVRDHRHQGLIAYGRGVIQTLPRRHFVAASAALALPGCAATTARTPASCLMPVKASPDRVIRTLAGLRPYRPGGFVVRADALGAQRLVHNYGHGGPGITMSWVTAELAGA